MCPSYRVTRDEEHSTRGRAHLLFEMLRGDPLDGGWRDEHVKDALDLCLSCKGCKGDCPVQRRHGHLQGRIPVALLREAAAAGGRVRDGFVHRWARLASHRAAAGQRADARAGLVGHLQTAWRRLEPRDVPRFARRTFVDWFGERQRRNGSSDRQNGEATRVILWPDTFNNYFHPSVADRRDRGARSGKLRSAWFRRGRSAAAVRCTTTDF